MSRRPTIALISLLEKGRRTRTTRLGVATVLALALAAGVLSVPPVTSASADPTVTFPVPEHEFDPSYQDVLGVHVPTTEPTIHIYSWDEVEPSEGYVAYSVEIEIATDEESAALASATVEMARDEGSSSAAWTVPAEVLSFDESYVLHYRLSGNDEQGEWVDWRPFLTTTPSPAPALVSPADGLLTTSPVWLEAQVPDFVPSPETYDTIIFTIETGWQEGAPTVIQQTGEIDEDGTARTQFSPTAREGLYRWNAQWSGSGYSRPSDFRELTVSVPAPVLQYVYIATDSLSATVNYYVDSPALAPVEYIDVTITPGDFVRRVPAGDSAPIFDLPLGDYTATLTSTNALGTSAPTTKSFTIVPTAPTSPGEVAATAAETTAHVTWTAPLNDGGAPVEQYYVTVTSYNGGANQTFYTSDLFADFAVEVGYTYVIYVQAVNSIGTGDAAGAFLSVYGVPGAPENVEYLPGDGFVNVYWDAPANDGGTPPTTYRVRVKGVGTYNVTAQYSRMGIQIDGLENDQPYTITVRAVNEIGPGVVTKLTDVMPISSDLDTDADGLPDVVEIRFGTSSALPDTDNDGIGDADEALKLSAFLSPTIADTDEDGTLDSDEDSDEDGLSNADEIAAGTNPSAPDTDHDNLSDAAETTGGTSATVADTDSDGVEDGSELASGLDPTTADSDGDGTPDGETIATQTVHDGAQYAPTSDPQLNWEEEPSISLGGVSAEVTALAGRIDDLVVMTSPSDEIVGALTAVAAVFDTQEQSEDTEIEGLALLSTESVATASDPASISVLSFRYNANVDPDRLAELAPVVWNPDTYLWEFADNDVSISTAAHTVSILSPALGLRYAVVDLRTWRAHIAECDNGASGRPQLDVEFVIDELPSVVAQDQTNERFAAAQAVLSSLRAGDTASVREFGLMGIVSGGGSGSSPNGWAFSTGLRSVVLTPEEDFGLNSRERAALLLTKLDSEWSPGALNYLPTGSVGWDPETVLFDSRPSASVEVNPYVPNAVPMTCRKKVVVLITDGDVQGDEYFSLYPVYPDPDDPFSNTGVPVHVLDIGAGQPDQTDWMVQLADDTDGTYSYVPTAIDLAGWIDDVAPDGWPQGDPNQDTDGDTIPDMVETYGITSTLGKRGSGTSLRFYSDPLKADSDHDLIPDNLEIGQALAIGTQNAAWTSTTINRNYWIISDPGKDDGDDDGLNDRAEIDAGMNPISGDGDGDGLLDGEEEQNGTFAQAYDTDWDGFSDAFEVYHEADGYDPREHNDKVSQYEWLAEAAIGFFCGEVDVCSQNQTIPWLVGNIASGLLVFGDLRDGIGLIARGDFISAAFCAAGLIPGIGDLAGSASKVVRFVLKIFNPIALLSAGVPAPVAAFSSFGNMNSWAAMRILRQLTADPAKFVEALSKIDPKVPDFLRTNFGVKDVGIRDMVLANGIGRMKAYAALDSTLIKVYPYTATTKPKYLESGLAGEKQLRKVVPEITGPQIRETVQIGGQPKVRYWDGKYAMGPIVHYFESKVGYVASSFATTQALKDIARLTDVGGEFEWHFFASFTTGKIGPSMPLLKVLTDAGISVVFHFPAGARP